MVAFTQQGYKEFVHDNGDPNVKLVAGTGVAGSINPETLSKLPSETFAKEIRLSIIAAMNINPVASENTLLQSLLRSLEINYPMITEIADKNLHICIQDQREKLYDLFVTYIPLREQLKSQKLPD